MSSPTTAVHGAQRPLWRSFLVFLGPMVLSNVLQALSGTFNNVFIGRILGTHALASVSAMFPVIFFFISLIIGVGAGSSVLIGQAWGAREVHKVKAIAGTAIAVGALMGLFVAIFGGVFTERVLMALGTPPDILPSAVAYARVMMLAMPGLLVFILFTQLVRGVGDTATPMYALLLSTCVSALLTPAFIHGWLGLPQLGVVSSAAASIASFVAALSYMAIHMLRVRHPLAPDAELLRHIRINGAIFRLVLRIGVPTGVQMIVISVAELVLLALVNRFGSDATAAYGAVNQVVNYVQFPAMSIAITASIIGAQSIGAGRADRLGAITKTGLQLNLIITGPLVLLGYLLSDALIRLFIVNEHVVVLAESLLHIVLWSALVYGFAGVVSGVMRASGAVLVPVLISVVCIAAIEVPTAYILAAHIGIKGVWMTYPVTFCSMLLFQSLYYRLVWRRQKIQRLV